MLDAHPAFLEAVRPFQPMFRFMLDDLALVSPSALSSRRLHALARLVQLAFWSSRSLARLQEAAPLLAAILATLVLDERSHALLTHLFHYVLSTAPDVDLGAVRTILLEIAGPQGREDVMNAAEQLMAEGEQRGEQKALRAAIANVLETRALPLSELGRARLASCADVATLTRWLKRAVTASSEAEVFASVDAP